MNLHSGRGASGAMLRLMGCANGRSARRLLHSDCVVDEKTVELQKKENEGFGFVLRGAKADTPIEEFTPTPAFPALQYLESVDEGGVAWQAGLRTGDFLIEICNTGIPPDAYAPRNGCAAERLRPLPCVHSYRARNGSVALPCEPAVFTRDHEIILN
ncbi:unnamed protein product [Boreogadus saida]